ncbi:hypothetical protein HMN09_01009400 [Mycena chlorophos]|uniref:DNA helicase n=1 Tax=Mycena chlorophos TaxID=658473 RepID=A0A8H6VZW9_MYCCL|nr:hypothetical protein HMN09_01009400 [Mycena chlorophos]
MGILPDAPGLSTRRTKRGEEVGQYAPPEVQQRKRKGKGQLQTVDSKAVATPEPEPEQPVASTSRIDDGPEVVLKEGEAQFPAVSERHESDELASEQFQSENVEETFDPQPEQQNEEVSSEAKSEVPDAASSVVSTSPRKTRSARAELLKLSGASTSKRPPVSEYASIPDSPQRIVVKRVWPPPPASGTSKAALAKGKGKEKAAPVPIPRNPRPQMQSSTMVRRSHSTEQSSSTRQRRKRGVDADPLPTEAPPRKRRKLNGSASTAIPRDQSTRYSSSSKSASAPVNGRGSRRRGVDVPTPEPPQAVIKIKRPRPPETPPPRLPQNAEYFFSPSTGIKRVRLIVRRPPPRFLSHHRQRPPNPQFSSSLPAFLASYAEVDGQTYPLDSTTQSNEEVLQLASARASLLERVASMRRAGTWFGQELLDHVRSRSDDDGSGTVTPNAPDGGVVPTDVWTHIVAAVQQRRREKEEEEDDPDAPEDQQANNNKTRGEVVAAEIAALIRAYWEAEAVRREKVRLAEERRMRGLAKAVGKLVLAEWKKAVFHIRQMERRKLEAEEIKRGHEHLDAILDQSGHILEAQQGDLTRGLGSRSRSGSFSGLSQWEESEEEDDDDDQDEDAEGEGEEEDAEGEEEDAVGETDDAVGETECAVGEAEDALGGADDAVGEAEVVVRDEVDALGEEDAEGEDEDAEGEDEDVEGEDEDAEGEDDDALGEEEQPDPEKLDQAQQDPLQQGQPRQADPLQVEPPQDEPQYDELRQLKQQYDELQQLEQLQDELQEDEQQTAQAVEQQPADDDSDYGLRIYVDEYPVGAEAEDEGLSALLVGPLTPLDTEDEADSDAHLALPEDMEDVPMEDLREESEDEASDADEQAAPANASLSGIPPYLRPYAVAPVEYDSTKRVLPPNLLRGNLRPYQYSGLEWLASLHQNRLNGILADEMGLGKTIQTISLLAHLACDRGIWGPHLIVCALLSTEVPSNTKQVVPTSVLLNWEMEFKKFLPGFRVISYHGNVNRRRELRKGWTDKNHFNVCITSYTLASRDALVFKRKPWYYLILDEAHMIKNFKSQRWTTLLMFRSFRRLLLTGTPLQNNLTELWSLLQFLMSGSEFVNLKEFGDWFSNPLEKAIEAGNMEDEDTIQRVTKLHTVLRPYLLRRLKRDVEKELPRKYEHVVLCPLSKRQRFLYDEFMSRAQTRHALQSGVYLQIANILMQLRKVCNHPDLFEVRPIVTSFMMRRSAVADFEIKELLVRRRLLAEPDDDVAVGLDFLNLRFIHRQDQSLLAALETRRLDETARLPFMTEILGAQPPKDTRTIAGFRAYSAFQKRAEYIARTAYMGYINCCRCAYMPIYGSETLDVVRRLGPKPILPLAHCNTASDFLHSVFRVNAAVQSYVERAEQMASTIDRFAFCTPAVVAQDLPHLALAGPSLPPPTQALSFDAVLHRASVKLQIAFPDPSLLQYDCGKLQRLAELLQEKKAGHHRVLIFTQMTRVLDILEMFLSFHGYLYLRLDGATRIEDRQYITERFNADPRVFCFIASSRSGGVGINLTGADTVVFYDSDFNPQMDRQCEDRAHRIGQIRDVHIYRFVSTHTVEEAMLRKANQKRSLDDLVIQKGEFDWRSLLDLDANGADGLPSAALTKALAQFDDTEDAHAADVAAREEVDREGLDEEEFRDEGEGGVPDPLPPAPLEVVEEDEDGGGIADYMIAFVQRDMEFFADWRV